MKITLNRDALLPALTKIGGVIEKRQTLPILSNLLVRFVDSKLRLIATDLEVELKTDISIESDSPADEEFTLPAKKFSDICRALPEGTDIDLKISGERVFIKAAKSKFTLGVLPATDYPVLEAGLPTFSLTLKQSVLKRLIDKTAFAMAQQDVRYYLNGLLLELDQRRVRAVATDGHRLAMCEQTIDTTIENVEQVLLPRKAVIELGRFLDYSDEEIEMELTKGVARFKMGDTIFTTKLIDGKFPDYTKVIPVACDKFAAIDRDSLKSALIRASILSSEKYKGIRMSFSDGTLTLTAHNPEQEEAEEELDIEYDKQNLSIGFNVGYVLDVLNAIDTETVRFELLDTNSSALVKEIGNDDAMYVVMPMRL